MKWKLKNGQLPPAKYIGERLVRTRIRERLGPLSKASLPLADGKCLVCGEAFQPGDYWTVVNVIQVPIWSEPRLQVKQAVNECAHWRCWKKGYRSLDAV